MYKRQHPDSEDCERCGRGAVRALGPAGSREIEHIGSAHWPGRRRGVEDARPALHANQDSVDFDDGGVGAAEAPIVGNRARHLWETLTPAYRVLGLDRPCPDEVFCQLVLARVVESVSKLDSIRGVGRARDRRAVVSHD